MAAYTDICEASLVGLAAVGGDPVPSVEGGVFCARVTLLWLPRPASGRALGKRVPATRTRAEFIHAPVDAVSDYWCQFWKLGWGNKFGHFSSQQVQKSMISRELEEFTNQMAKSSLVVLTNQELRLI